MDEIVNDSRFSHVLKDAKFRKLPKKQVKVKIDKRFQSMFHEKKFQVKCEVDKRGRSVNLTSSEDLKRYYEMSDSGDDGHSDDDDEEKEKEESVRREETEDVNQNKSIVAVRENEKKILTPEIKKKLKDLTIDYARGEGAILSDSSSDEESTDEEDQLEFDHGWGELDKDADQTTDSTNRLAVCNLNWDRIEAADLMVLFHSFLPSGGIIHSVTIYPSDFGLKRMKEEDEKGPMELLEGSEEEKDEEELSKIQMEKLRKYQLNRLKYYYAVVVCNTPQIAEALYNECDGLDYECSSSKLDLRFIPDDMTFENEPKETCTTLPDLSTYKPKYFVTSALTKAKVDLTWDETDLNRQEAVKSIHNGNVDEINLRKYLACSSSESEEEEEEDKNEDKNDAAKNKESSKKMKEIDKFKALLADIESNESKSKKNAVNMEVTWNLELENKANKVVKEVVNEKNAKTPFEKYLEKRKEKKKKKRLEKQQQLQSHEQGEQEESDGGAFSDDDIPSDIDLNDAYFKEELDAFKSKKSSKKKKHEEEVEDEETKQKKAELQLLMLDNEPDNKHFSLKKIEESEKETKKKGSKKGKKRKAEESNQFKDNFKIDVNDERFSAIYTSHHFNIDPANPQFKATKATRELMEEKLKRREVEESGDGGGLIPKKKTREIMEEDRMGKEQNKNDELLNLVKSIKKNTRGAKEKTSRH